MQNSVNFFNTTGIAANLLDRNFVGIEKENEFVDMSIMRKNELDSKISEFRKKIKDLQNLKTKDTK